MPNDTNDAAIAISIIGLAKSFDIDVLAEGAQLNFLMLHGRNKFQGYLSVSHFLLISLKHIYSKILERVALRVMINFDFLSAN
jgi:EAL domain-containing protein (putative c-di-GMP-specific phosphodiesterase class I)